MSRLNDLVDRVGEANPELARRLELEVRTLASRREFGLNFERHIPEAVRLPGRVARRGDRVVHIPPRKAPTEKVGSQTWIVADVTGKGKKRVADLVELKGLNGGAATCVRALEDLAVIAEFRDPIFPGLRSTGKVERGGDKPWHTVINGENYHALEALKFAYEGAVDCIYIDPPYNTRDKDWKYNNDYVDSDDEYRHSKWLAMMERRLKLARDLLNPEDSALIVTIDEKEYLRLGLLLQQVFPAARIQMVTSSIKPSGSRRATEFSRVEEYLFCVMIGAAMPAPWRTDMLRDHQVQSDEVDAVTWHGLRRRGSTDWKREHRANGFYPVFVRKKDGTIHSVGEPIPLKADRTTVKPPRGTFAAWPLDPEGEEGRWQISPSRFRDQLAEGTLGLNSADAKKGAASVVYLKSGDRKKVQTGEVEVAGKGEDGRLIIGSTAGTEKRPKTMWVMDSHDASTYGTALLRKFTGGREFPFPKSLYAVEDTLRFFVADKADALILDFFAGSGTTAHAVMRLNRQDGGRRRSICVTNNEVSDAEAKELAGHGLRPGDREWERMGICEYVTKPRITAAIEGKTPKGKAVAGEYKFTDGFAFSDGFEENAEYFDLTYEDPDRVRHALAFAAVDALLWLRAGADGARIEDPGDGGYALATRYAVLFEIDAAADFLAAVRKAEGVRVAYIVTDEEKQFQVVADQLPRRLETVRLYESYLRTFRINVGEE